MKPLSFFRIFKMF